MKLLVDDAVDHVVGSLPCSGFSVWAGRDRDASMMMEIFASGGIADVVVAGTLGAPLLHGAIRGRRPMRRSAWALAWGQLPPGRSEVMVVFAGSKGLTSVEPTIVAGTFWLAEAPGDFQSVSVAAGPDRATSRTRRIDRRCSKPPMVAQNS